MCSDLAYISSQNPFLFRSSDFQRWRMNIKKDELIPNHRYQAFFTKQKLPPIHCSASVLKESLHKFCKLFKYVLEVVFSTFDSA